MGVWDDEDFTSITSILDMNAGYRIQVYIRYYCIENQSLLERYISHQRSYK